MAKHKDPPKDKHPGGRPPDYKTVEEMQAKIDEYFELSKGEMLLDAEGTPIIHKGAPIYINGYHLTVTGLAIHLGFTSRQALLNYQNKKEFVDAITRAKLKIEDYANQRLFDKEGVRGAMFALSVNYGYVEKKATEHSGNVGFKIVDDID